MKQKSDTKLNALCAMCATFVHPNDTASHQDTYKRPPFRAHHQEYEPQNFRRWPTACTCLHVCLFAAAGISRHFGNLKLYVRWVAKHTRCSVETTLERPVLGSPSPRAIRQLADERWPQISVHPVTPVLGPESGPANYQCPPVA
jgi:hypothetical protein